MADSAPKLMFTLEDISATENRSPFPATNISSFGEETRHRSSPNFRQIKGREPRIRTESASEAVETDHVGELAHFRSRSSSAPSSLMKAAHYGRELRRMSDEFDQIFPHLPRPKSAGAATQMTISPSFRERFFSFFRGKSKEKIEAEDEQH